MAHKCNRQNEILNTQNKILNTQNKIPNTQNKIPNTQNKIPILPYNSHVPMYSININFKYFYARNARISASQWLVIMTLSPAFHHMKNNSVRVWNHA